MTDKEPGFEREDVLLLSATTESLKRMKDAVLSMYRSACSDPEFSFREQQVIYRTYLRLQLEINRRGESDAQSTHVC